MRPWCLNDNSSTTSSDPKCSSSINYSVANTGVVARNYSNVDPGGIFKLFTCAFVVAAIKALTCGLL